MLAFDNLKKNTDRLGTELRRGIIFRARNSGRFELKIIIIDDYQDIREKSYRKITNQVINNYKTNRKKTRTLQASG